MNFRLNLLSNDKQTRNKFLRFEIDLHPLVMSSYKLSSILTCCKAFPKIIFELEMLEHLIYHYDTNLK